MGRSEEQIFELFLRVDDEVVDTHLVGLGQVGVVGFDCGQVALEDQFPVFLLMNVRPESGLEVLPSDGLLLVLYQTKTVDVGCQKQ